MVTMTRELEPGLIEAGVSPEQAEKIAVGLDERLSEVATKQDLRDLKEDLERQIDKLEPATSDGGNGTHHVASGHWFMLRHVVGAVIRRPHVRRLRQLGNAPPPRTPHPLRGSSPSKGEQIPDRCRCDMQRRHRERPLPKFSPPFQGGDVAKRQRGARRPLTDVTPQHPQHPTHPKPHYNQNRYVHDPTQDDPNHAQPLPLVEPSIEPTLANRQQRPPRAYIRLNALDAVARALYRPTDQSPPKPQALPRHRPLRSRPTQTPPPPRPTLPLTPYSLWERAGVRAPPPSPLPRRRRGEMSRRDRGGPPPRRSLPTQRRRRPPINPHTLFFPRVFFRAHPQPNPQPRPCPNPTAPLPESLPLRIPSPPAVRRGEPAPHLMRGCHVVTEGGTPRPEPSPQPLPKGEGARGGEDPSDPF